MTRISLNVIVYNEEARLEECLTDARDFVDEIVVVDQMSTDRTPEIAERLADVYIRDVHHGHAEPSRELAASRSSGDWLLILDADEKMSDLLKGELRSLVEGDADGYWIRKVNFVGEVETGTILHYRLVRKSRVRFDPGPHGGATALSENVETFDPIGIVHEKTVAEQVFDDARYERIAREDVAPTSSKRNWLAHNLTLREQREQARRSDLERLVPADSARVLVVGNLRLELPGTVVRVDHADKIAIAREESATPDEDRFDAAVVALTDDDPIATVRTVAGLVRPGGVIVGTAAAARNRRRLEEIVAGVLSDDPGGDTPAIGVTRRGLTAGLLDAGLDVRWMALVPDGRLDALPLRPDGSGAVVESQDFLLRSVPADVAEELTAAEIVFAAVAAGTSAVPACSVVVAALDGCPPQRFADALAATAPEVGYDLVVVEPEAALATSWNAGARAAAGELLIFVTSDAEPQPGWLDGIVRTHRSRPDMGAVGSKVVSPGGTIEHAGIVLSHQRIPYRLYEGDAATAPHVNRPRLMPAVAAVGMATGRARFVEVGGFEETLGDDLTDADLCLRLRARGLPIMYAPGAVLVSPRRAVPGTRDDFRRSVREFTARWSRASLRSDEALCRADGCDINTQWNRSWRLPRSSGASSDGLPTIAWTSHFLEQGGYTEEAISIVEALDDAGMRVVANPVALDGRGSPLPPKQAQRLADLLERDLPADFVHVAHIGANRLKRHPAAMSNVGRTMFETDGLPPDWRDQCNLMDEIWVPSDHNLRTFARAGVDVSKLHKVPETFDASLFRPDVVPLPIEDVDDGFVFLSMFSWIERKAWDVLLRAWFKEFQGHDDVTLVLKTDIDNSPGTDVRREIESFVRGRLGLNPKKGPRIVVLDRPMDSTEVPRLYRASDAFVLATRGEGWGRPLMEAMVMGLPTIATRWSGNLDFMDDDNSYLVDYELVAAPMSNELARGQRWAEPSVKDLRRAMRQVYENRSEAAAIGARARADVLVSCSAQVLVAAVRERIEAIDRHPVLVSPPATASLAPTALRRATEAGRRLTACVVVNDAADSVPQCLASLDGIADSIVLVEADPTGDIASARNEAIDRATGHWVLMLDATHTLDPASVAIVDELVDRDRFVGYAAREVHQVGLDGAISTVALRTVCLFPRHPDLRYVGRVAEQLLPQRPDLRFRLVPSDVVLHQHDHRVERDPVAAARRDLPELQRSVRESPEEPFHVHNLGVALERLGLHVEAETVLRQAISQAPPNAMWEAPSLAALARAVAAQGRNDDAVRLSKKATKRAPDWAQGWCLLGASLVDAGRPKAALRAYQRALDCADDASMLPGDPDDTTWQVHAGIGRVHLAREEFGQAAESLRAAVTLNPGNVELRIRLARAYEAVGQAADARNQLERAVTIARAGAGAYVAVSDFFTRRAEDALLRGLADNPESGALLERIERLRTARALY